jgi:hypothetical protein
VVDLDLSTPDILKGLARKARRGRVDAAKLALEITGRHVTKGEATMPNIVVQIGGLPRPTRRPDRIEDAEVVDVEAEEE